VRKSCGLMLAVGVLAAGRPAAPATLVADYGFQGTLASSVGSPPDLTGLGPGTNSFVADTVDGESRTVLVFPQDNGVSLSPTTGVIPNDRFAIVILFRLDTVTGYRRVLDFKNGQDDCGLYLLDGTLHFFCDSSGTSVITPGTYVQVVLTRDGSANVVGYVDGTQELTFNDSLGDGVIDANNTLRFFRDNECVVPTCGEDSAGAVARIRLYDDALTAAEVAALDRTPTPTTTTVTIRTTTTTIASTTTTTLLTTLPLALCPETAAAAAVQAAIDARCDCLGATRHGAYVRCAVGVAKAAVKAGTLPRRCKGAVKSCAARSTCGKPGFVTCCRTTATGATKCSIKRAPAQCKPPRGGTACVGHRPSCCDACATGGCAP